ncbi:MAG: YciK family oxidoreductase [Gammaproteobacteria bacterium]|nr:YciK family oxidoreductase [Gammaproteobacteria bacterium]MYB36130.1 YciK family oxidoreductase [Gammaproteobacteria bacterium]
MTVYSPPSDLLAERCVLVTGAGDGIGRAAALAYARHGANVVLLGRTRAKLEAVFDHIAKETKTRPTIVPADLQHLGEDSASALREGIERDYGRLDGILHNASLLGPRNPVEHYPATDWHAVMQVNVNAAFLLTRALLPLLNQSQDASVILTSSGVGRRGRAYWGAYAVAKFATEGLMEVLADECAHAGRVRVNSLNPGGTRTAMRAAAYPTEDPATLPIAESHMPLYLYLMGPDSKGVTGQRFDAKAWQVVTRACPSA